MIIIPFPSSHSLFKKEMNTMINATAAMSPIIIARVFSISSSLLFVSSTRIDQQHQMIRTHLTLSIFTTNGIVTNQKNHSSLY